MLVTSTFAAGCSTPASTYVTRPITPPVDRPGSPAGPVAPVGPVGPTAPSRPFDPLWPEHAASANAKITENRRNIFASMEGFPQTSCEWSDFALHRQRTPAARALRCEPMADVRPPARVLVIRSGVVPRLGAPAGRAAAWRDDRRRARVFPAGEHRRARERASPREARPCPLAGGASPVRVEAPRDDRQWTGAGGAPHQRTSCLVPRWE